MTDRDHEVEAIAAGTRYLLRGREERARILDGLLKAINQSAAVQALIHANESAAEARPRLMDLLDVDQFQLVTCSTCNGDGSPSPTAVRWPASVSD